MSNGLFNILIEGKPCLRRHDPFLGVCHFTSPPVDAFNWPRYLSTCGQSLPNEVQRDGFRTFSCGECGSHFDILCHAFYLLFGSCPCLHTENLDHVQDRRESDLVSVLFVPLLEPGVPITDVCAYTAGEEEPADAYG